MHLPGAHMWWKMWQSASFNTGDPFLILIKVAYIHGLQGL